MLSRELVEIRMSRVGKNIGTMRAGTQVKCLQQFTGEHLVIFVHSFFMIFFQMHFFHRGTPRGPRPLFL